MDFCAVKLRESTIGIDVENAEQMICCAAILLVPKEDDTVSPFGSSIKNC
jgi:hypothetical protein